MFITLCVPTRHRQHRINDLFYSLNHTINQFDKVQIALYIDDDDTITKEEIFIKAYPKLNFFVYRGPRTDGSSRYNILAEKTQGDLLGYFADDVIFLSTGWDDNLRKHFSSFPDMIMLAAPTNPDSLEPKSKKATHGFVSRKSTEIVGSFFPVDFIEFFHDEWLTEIYKSIGRFIFCKDISVRHNSFRWNRMLKDEIYKRGDLLLPDGRTILKAMHDLYNSEEKIKDRKNWTNKLFNSIS